MLQTFLTSAYLAVAFALAVSGLHHFVLLALFIRGRHRPTPAPAPPEVWPTVTVQLPTYNERFVVERLIDAACQLEYPAGRLTVQVVDDSTDETTDLARARVNYHRKQGVEVRLLHRRERRGFKSGALHDALLKTDSDLIAVLDADFVPPRDFLTRLVPYLANDPGAGMVQGRWGHLNDTESWLTRSQAFAIDAQFVVVQEARYASGLLVKFNGSGGIWRRACIWDAGGWEPDTITEDLDLSLRAQMRGWRFHFVPDVIVPAEIPSSLTAYKRQQQRWAHGSTQVLRKLGGRMLAAPLSVPVRADGLLQMFAYLHHFIVASLLLIWLPLLLLAGIRPPSVPYLAPLALAGPLIIAVSQQAVYPDWRRRMLYLPVLTLVGVGLGLNNSAAVVSAILKRKLPFVRTPKGFGVRNPKSRPRRRYHLPKDWTFWGEIGLACGASAAALQLIRVDLGNAIPLAYLGLAYGFVAVWQILESVRGRIISR